jgi:hypothetical protein
MENVLKNLCRDYRNTFKMLQRLGGLQDKDLHTFTFTLVDMAQEAKANEAQLEAAKYHDDNMKFVAEKIGSVPKHELGDM